MIKSVELADFLSHSDTKLTLGNGVTVFVGHNGAGKSSVIDGITFALFGAHTRRTNKNLIRRGQSQGYATVDFTVNGKDYRVIRKITTKGSLSAQLLERDGEWAPIAEGERRQFGESVTKMIESILGLDYDKLKIASIVQQGELNNIIKAKPKEFKELINSIIGIDKLDRSSELMKDSIRHFREHIRNRLGYDDTQIDSLKMEIERCQEELQSSMAIKESLDRKKKEIQTDVTKLTTRVDEESRKAEKLNHVQSRRKELLNYARDVIVSIQREISEKERMISECRKCFAVIKENPDTETDLAGIEKRLEEITKEIQDCKMKIASFREQESLAKRLRLTNGRCPVCNSAVDHLNPLFQEKHLQDELSQLNQTVQRLEKEKEDYKKKRQEAQSRLHNIKSAQTTLQTYSIDTEEEIDKIQKEIANKKSNIRNISLGANISEYAAVDSHAKMLYDNILALEKEIEGFDFDAFGRFKAELASKQRELSEIDIKLGGTLERIRKNKEQIATMEGTITELEDVKRYCADLERIQGIFNRDGPVAMSLRSWALNTISSLATEYLLMLDTKINRIELSEKARDISITCYSKGTSLDIESLSGGEQVSIALSLRLGMAQLLGASNLNFIILDEPTIHLDEERRKALVKVLSQISSVAGREHAPMQFIIITHDAEIFEDSLVEQIYRFKSSNNGTIVTSL